MVLLPFPPLDSYTCDSWPLEKQHKQSPGEPYPNPERYCYLAGTITESSKSQSTFLSSQLLQDGKTIEFHEHGPISTLNLHYFLDQKQCCVECHDTHDKSMNGTFGRSTVCREGKPKYSREEKMLLLS